MPRQRSLVTVIRDTVRDEVQNAIQSLLGSVSGGKRAKNGRRRRGTWRPGGPGRPPKMVAAKLAHTKKPVATPVARKTKAVHRRRRRRRGPGRPAGSKKKAT